MEAVEKLLGVIGTGVRYNCDEVVGEEAYKVIMNCIFKNEPMIEVFVKANGLHLYTQHIGDPIAFISQPQPLQVGLKSSFAS